MKKLDCGIKDFLIPMNGTFKELVKQGIIKTIGTKRLRLCEHCVFCKSKRLKFTKGQHSTKEVLSYIHANIWDHLELLH